MICDWNKTPEVPWIKIIYKSTGITVSSSCSSVSDIARRRRSVDCSDDGTNEFFFIPFEIYLDTKTLDFRIEMENNTIHNEILNITEMPTDNIIVTFNDGNIIVANMRYVGYPPKFSPVPKRKN